MKIAQSSVAMMGQHDLMVKYEKEDSLIVRRAPPVPPTEAVAGTGIASKQPDKLEDFKAMLIQLLLEKLLGKKFHFNRFDPAQLQGDDGAKAAATLDRIKASRPAATQSPDWEFRYASRESYQEKENTRFASEGVVKTTDGKDISFSVSIDMSRDFQAENNVQVGNLKDPLVVNFAGTSAELTQTKFRFDLDADGAEDQISFLKPGSGFLALDSNGNGKIDDGQELFGTKSGNGFSDLAKYDEDKNGWIDENDQVFNQLRIWSKDEKGKDSLIGLGEAGVGAIFLGNVATPFDLKPENSTLGQIKSSGLFLREDGGAGSVQQIDLSL